MRPLPYADADCRPACITIGGVDYNGEMTDLRVANDHPFKFKYELRGDDDDCSEAVTVEEHVVVNFFGTFLTNTQILSEGEEYRILDKDGDIYCWGYVS